jgi:hypothetical protein
MRMMRSALGMGIALALGLMLAGSAAEARGGMGGGGFGGGGGFHGGFGGGGMAFFPHRMGGFGGGGFAMRGNPGFRRFGMAVPGRQFGPMGWRHANFHDFHDGRFHGHRNFFGFPFLAVGGFPYGDYGYYNNGYYGGDCSIAYRNARASGSSYWWSQYYGCVGYSY